MALSFFTPATSQAAPAATSQAAPAAPASAASSGQSPLFQLTPTNTSNVAFTGFGFQQSQPPLQAGSQPQQQQQAAAPAPATLPSFGFQQQQQPAAAASSAPPASGSLFGAAPTAPAASSSAGGLFAPKPAVTSAPAPGASLFGAAPAAPTSSGLFGSAPAPATSTGLFGSTPAPAAPAASTGLFGAAPATSTGGLFGSKPAAAPAAAPTTSLFGAAPAAGSSLFGNAPAAAAPSQQQPQQPSFAGFGQTKPFSVSQLGASQPAQQQQPGQQQQQQQAQQQQQQAGQQQRLGPSLSAKMVAIHQAWDVSNLQTCRFLHYLYGPLPAHLMGPTGAGGAGGTAEAYNLGRRPDAIGPRHEALWAQAVRENPEPGRLAPVLAIGFPDLKLRAEQQSKEASRQSTRLSDIQARLSTLEQAHTLRNATRVAAVQRRQVALDHRLLANARRAHLLIPSLRGTSVSKEEEALRASLERCEAQLEAVGSGVGQGRIRARVNELWALLGALKAKREQMRREGAIGAEWAVVDEGALEEVAKILAGQQQGLNHLIATLEADTKALDTVVKGLQGVQLVGVKGAR